MKIQAGHYYKTRDGRKLGPMKESGLASFPWTFKRTFWTREGNHWTADNEALDLVAEWQDEPVNAEPQIGNALDTATNLDWIHAAAQQRAVAYGILPAKPPSPPAEPDWLPWSGGGECPVHFEAYVEVRWPRNQGRTPACRCNWKNVTAYRVLWSPPEEQTKRKGEVFLAVMSNDGGEISYRAGYATEDLTAYARGCGVKVVAIVSVSWLEGDGL